MSKVNVTNLTSSKLSLDFKVQETIIRETLTPGGVVEIGEKYGVSMDELNANNEVAKLVTANKISLKSEAEATDSATESTSASQLFLGQPSLAAANGLVASVDWANGSLTLVAQPTVPRNVTATLTDANNSIAGLLTITGKDPQGRTVVETMQPNAAGGGKTLVGTKIFAQVLSAVISGSTGEQLGTDLIVVGYGTVVGMPFDIDAAAAVKHVWLGGVRQTSPVVATGKSTSGIDASAGTYDGTKVLMALVSSGG